MTRDEQLQDVLRKTAIAITADVRCASDDEVAASFVEQQLGWMLNAYAAAYVHIKGVKMEAAPFLEASKTIAPCKQCTTSLFLDELVCWKCGWRRT